jgi:hypothetical protein
MKRQEDMIERTTEPDPESAPRVGPHSEASAQAVAPRPSWDTYRPDFEVHKGVEGDFTITPRRP